MPNIPNTVWYIIGGIAVIAAIALFVEYADSAAELLPSTEGAGG